MTGFARFNKQWASTGSTLDPSDAQANAGFAFLGATPPSVELFNSIHQDLDDKDNVLFNWIAAVLVSAGITPADASPGQLLAALTNLTPGRMLGVQTFNTSGTYTPTSGTKAAIVEVQGGGGAGGGAGVTGAGQCSAGAGGGAGGWARKYIASSVVAQTVNIGVGGVGFSNGTGGSGGTTSFGSIVSATGGTGGSVGPVSSSTIAGVVGNGPGGVGSSGDVNGVGGHGSYAFYSVQPLGGQGGASHYGGGALYTSGTSNGNAAVTRGSGGSGGAIPASSGPATGGVGAPGIITVFEFS